MNPLFYYAAQAGVAAGIYLAAGLISRIFWDDRKER
jgi:hypothetical protein